MGNLANASNDNSIAIGHLTHASNNNSVAIGYDTTASGLASTALGLSTVSDDDGSTVVGKYNDYAALSTTVFQVGNGTDIGNRSNAFNIDNNGAITAPSFDISEITDPKALITKEYFETNSPTATGLEALNEGNGIGWRLIDRDPANYGNIGNNSIDFSFSNSASDTFGATGTGSIASGYQAIASTSYTVAFGYQTTASAPFSTAIGYQTVASGESSTAFGQSTNASGQYSTALGESTIASAQTSTALGNRSTASGTVSFASGDSSSATGYAASAFNSVTEANGDNSSAFGHFTQADAFGSFAIGRHNVGGGNPTSWIETDPLFEIGNSNTSSHTNALTVLKNGTIIAPSFDMTKITDPKALITKEYLEANSSAATGLETLDEGNGIGWRLVGSNPANYGAIGENAVDVSYNPDISEDFGALGTANFTAGYKTKASNLASTALDNFTVASGFSSTAIGFETIADDQFSTVVGRLNDNTTSTNVLFQVGNGTSGGRSNAFSVNMDGTITAPSFDMAEITDPKALITKEYADANYSGGSGSSSTGLETLDEGNGNGWRLVGSDPSNFGDIGSNAVDLSTSPNPSSVNGATGSFSFALGNNAEASGFASMAMGYNSKAQGSGAIAIGGTSTESGSIAIHRNSTGAGATAIAGGTASGENSIAIGINSDASAYNAIALGDGASTSGQYAVAVGHNTSSSGWNSFSSGINTEASGTQATAMGAGTIASGHTSVALGQYTRAEAPNTTAIGLFNVGGGDSLNESSTDPLFEIGNGHYVDGTNDVRTNALTVLRNGNATLAGTLTQNSDRRLKSNLENLSYGLNEILRLAPVSYNWKRYPEKGKSLGLIAQEVQPIINEIVHEAKDKDKTLSVSYIELIPVLIKAIQEQQAIIDQQAQTIQNQEMAKCRANPSATSTLKKGKALEKDNNTNAVIASAAKQSQQ